MKLVTIMSEASEFTISKSLKVKSTILIMIHTYIHTHTYFTLRYVTLHTYIHTYIHT
jgi:hypothetical protein